MNPLLRPNEEVRDALNRNLPIVALESTLITHGFPADRRRHIDGGPVGGPVAMWSLVGGRPSTFRRTRWG